MFDKKNKKRDIVTHKGLEYHRVAFIEHSVASTFYTSDTIYDQVAGKLDFVSIYYVLPSKLTEAVKKTRKLSFWDDKD